jgi:hypothetical protein
MSKYYALTNDSLVFRVAMSTLRFALPFLESMLILILVVLHPRHKTSYFVKAGWQREWIKAAEDLAQQEWQAYNQRWYLQHQQLHQLL